MVCYSKAEKLIIKIATDEGDFAFDSFLGNATTTAIAHKTNSKWLGAELKIVFQNIIISHY